MAAVTIAAVTTAVAIGGTIYSMKQADKQREEAKAQMKKQEDAQRAKEAELKKQADEQKKQVDAEKQQETNRKQQEMLRSRQKGMAGQLEGRQSTILTSPLGVQGDAAGGGAGAPAAGGKTLLGS